MVIGLLTTEIREEEAVAVAVAVDEEPMDGAVDEAVGKELMIKIKLSLQQDQDVRQGSLADTSSE